MSHLYQQLGHKAGGPNLHITSSSPRLTGWLELPFYLHCQLIRCGRHTASHGKTYTEPFQKIRKSGPLLRSDPTGSGRTEGRTKVESGGQLSTVHHRTRAGESEFKNRGDRRQPEPSRRIRAFRRTSDRDEGEVSNISSEVVEYKYTKYIY